LVKRGDKIEADEAVLEIATDKVDSEVPSEVSGIGAIIWKDDLVPVGQPLLLLKLKVVRWFVKAAASQEAVAEVTKNS
jgi:2-oxoglutarate dehydrogenase E2 component (dihydrolipoamide succinyltransferase)